MPMPMPGAQGHPDRRAPGVSFWSTCSPAGRGHGVGMADFTRERGAVALCRGLDRTGALF